MKTEVMGARRNAGEEDAHADESVGAEGTGEMREVDLLEAADGGAEHGSDEEGGREHAAGGAADEGECGGEILRRARTASNFQANWSCMAWSMDS